MALFFWITFLMGFSSVILFCIMKFNFDINKRLLLVFSIIGLLLAAPLVYCTITIKSPIGFITPEHYDAWISFYGSIIGGILTVLGVWWTIDAQENTRRKDLATQYKPFLDFISYEKHLPKGVNYTSIEYKFKNEVRKELITELEANKKKITKVFNMANIGRGVLSNICLDEVIIEDDYLNKLISFDKTPIGSLAPNQTIYFQIFLPPIMENEKEDKKIESKFKFIFTATDEFKYNYFTIELVIELLMERYTTYNSFLECNITDQRYEIIDMDTHFYNKKSNEQIY